MRWRPVLAVLAVLACSMFASNAFGDDAGFRVLDGDISLIDDVYYLNTRVDYQLSDAAREAMHSGLPLTFELQIEVERPRPWIWNQSVASLSQRYRLRYHDLSGRYILTNLNSGESRSFAFESAVLQAVGTVDALPLIDRRLLDEGEVYEVRVRARLDVNGLPQPLRAIAMVSRQWRLASEWVSWRLQV
ncbi:hypothetical protein CAI21_20365 [Alkalilimnicola ehrlichii]|uniref:DUF4390 domain-containing protein n=1 Tax=Alkalilimnicola ehrlichii TaxID=351052 RepID=A0A3E0WGX5_9GAMM|nr:hypothetical protein CAI21_20365 [Alkalilimnicola ehrlichii]RFA32008.1 hypothetical protein CAL65_20865 [Alkalilimnicola ehrlichii]